MLGEVLELENSLSGEASDMSTQALEFAQSLSNDREVVGFISAGVLDQVLAAWRSLHSDDGLLRVRLPYKPGRRDRQLAQVLLQKMGQPSFSQAVSTARAWEMVAGQCLECGCALVVIENGDLLDGNSLAFVSRQYLPAVILVGGERLGRRLDERAGRAARILQWGRDRGEQSETVGS